MTYLTSEIHNQQGMLVSHRFRTGFKPNEGYSKILLHIKVHVGTVQR